MAENLEKIRPVLTALEFGDEVTFPISRLKSVRTQASELGAIFNRQFKTKTNRDKNKRILLYTINVLTNDKNVLTNGNFLFLQYTVKYISL